MAESNLGTARARIITSPANPVVRVFRRNLEAGLSPEGWLAVEGPILIGEALGAACAPDAADGSRPVPGVRIHSVLATEREAARFAAAIARLPHPPEINIVTDELFRRIAQTETPQGIAALVELPARTVESALGGPAALAVVACGLQDPGNLGTMVRSSQALGASALVTLRNTVSPYNPKAMRSSAGAVFRLPTLVGLDPVTVIGRLRGLGLKVIAADVHSAVRIAQVELDGPVAVLVGQEAAGLDAALLEGADMRAAIPLRREADSLNAASAATIFLYEAARQRGFRFDEPV